MLEIAGGIILSIIGITIIFAFFEQVMKAVAFAVLAAIVLILVALLVVLWESEYQPMIFLAAGGVTAYWLYNKFEEFCGPRHALEYFYVYYRPCRNVMQELQRAERLSEIKKNVEHKRMVREENIKIRREEDMARRMLSLKDELQNLSAGKCGGIPILFKEGNKHVEATVYDRRLVRIDVSYSRPPYSIWFMDGNVERMDACMSAEEAADKVGKIIRKMARSNPSMFKPSDPAVEY